MKQSEFTPPRIKPFLLLIISVVPAFCIAQNKPPIDSLKSVLKYQPEDSSRVQTLNLLSRLHWQRAKYSDGVNYADEALALAEKIIFHPGRAEALNNKGIIASYQSNHREALQQFSEALRISEKSKFYKGVVGAYNGIAGVYYAQGNYPESLKNLFALLKIGKEGGDKKGVSNFYNNIAIIYAVQGNYSEAIKNHFASLSLKEELGDKNGVSNSFANIGLKYSSQGNYPEALNHYFKSLKIKEQLDDKQGIANTCNSIGLAYMNQHKYSEAMDFCFASLRKNEEIGYKIGIAHAYNSLGLIYGKLHNYEDALKYHHVSLKINEELGDNKAIACSYINLGEANTSLGDYSEARKLLLEGLNLSKKVGAKDDIKNCYEQLSRLDSSTGNWKGAFYNHKQFILYRDSLQNEAHGKKIMEAQLKYEFQRREDSLNYLQQLTSEQLKQQSLLAQQHQQSLAIKEMEVSLMLSDKKVKHLELEAKDAAFALQKADINKKNRELLILNNQKAIQTLRIKKQEDLRNYLFLVLTLFGILAILMYKNYSTRQKLKLQTLRNKIASDLHDDVGSTLSSISIFSQMVQQQSKEVNPMLETIEESSRKMLDAMADIVWTINPENDQFEKIILRMRNFAYEVLGAKGIDFEFIADDEVERLKLLMDVRKNLYLIFKEAVNNMIKYSGADKALFSLSSSNNNLTMLIKDNGKGFAVENSRVGNGLKNMKKRADEIGGQLTIDSLPGKGTTIVLNLAV
ncbi:tetratricopeptide repeat-containing sensor histidine kinase [Flavihumibacter sp. ZG627]|uniref:tetratricopeptide repeat-containing sensor histidine kinase n=1 Tax=Flavihumibacter sp. ZG627 TaxID=1463156 RepID=UPI0005807D06|nr:tetratricopeptide repeat-containing sensor histidine kinase [Flavihumibacter sp. ZG627]KIC92020.1 hypothetical protein HY58_00070 [Flavihumibacter sp. ZG627]